MSNSAAKEFNMYPLYLRQESSTASPILKLNSTWRRQLISRLRQHYPGDGVPILNAQLSANSWKVWPLKRIQPLFGTETLSLWHPTETSADGPQLEKIYCGFSRMYHITGKAATLPSKQIIYLLVFTYTFKTALLGNPKTGMSLYKIDKPELRRCNLSCSNSNQCCRAVSAATANDDKSNLGSQMT